MDKTEFFNLLEKYVDGDASPEEIAQLSHIYEKHQKATPSNLPESIQAMKKKQLQHLLQKIRKSSPEQKNTGKGIGIRRLLVAASAAILLITTFVIYQHVRTDTLVDVKWLEIVTAKGERRKVLLPDGTHIHLNSSSRLIYPEKFQQNKREISFAGEALFEVKSNKNAPFLIKTDKMNVEVLGTTFNIKAYPEDEIAETALISGSVKIISKTDINDVVLLKPNQKYVVHKVTTQDHIAVRAPNNSDTPSAPVTFHYNIDELTQEIGQELPEETEWTMKKLTLRDETLSDIATRLERWYNVQIIFENESVAKKIYSAKFENEDLDNLLKALQVVSTFNYRKEDNGKIIIY